MAHGRSTNITTKQSYPRSKHDLELRIISKYPHETKELIGRSCGIGVVISDHRGSVADGSKKASAHRLRFALIRFEVEHTDRI